MDAKQKTLMYETLGMKIKQIRLTNGISQKKLGQEIGLSRPSIVNIEGGKQCPSLHILIDLSNFLRFNFLSFLVSGKWIQDFEEEKLADIERQILKKAKEANVNSESILEFVKKLS